VKITIDVAQNGAHVTFNPEDESSSVARVYEFDEDDPHTGLVGLRDMLYDITEEMGVIGSKHHRERIISRIVHGDDYDCPDKDKGCRICGDGSL
jgi:hypothetical protein